MRKLLLFKVFVCLTIFSFSQKTEKGKWLIGGSTDLSFSSVNLSDTDDETNLFNFSGFGGHFITDDLNGGLFFDFARSSAGDESVSSTSIGPYIRYYVNSTAYVGIGYGIQSATLDDGIEEITLNGGAVNFEAGIIVWINDTFAVEPGMSYSVLTDDFDGSSLGVLIGISAFF